MTKFFVKCYLICIMSDYPLWLWLGFGAFILLMLSLDLGLFNKKTHAPSYKETLSWSIVWVSLALLFNVYVFYQYGAVKGTEFLTGYLLELSLSVDNLFVFLLVFTYFKVKPEVQHRVLFWGVLGALVMRLIMIFIGTALVQQFEWLIFVFGAFLIYTGIKMFSGGEEDAEPDKNPLVKLVTRFVPIVKHYDGAKFFTKHEGKTVGTLLFLVLIVVEVTDLVFAVDSIPAILGITNDPFIVYTSNVFAILGLRTFFFLLVKVVEKFYLLKYGLAFVLTFIGIKMLLPLFVEGGIMLANAAGAPDFAHFLEPIIAKENKQLVTYISLGVVVSALSLSIICSLIFPQKEEFHGGIHITPEHTFEESDFDEEQK